jgi:hypothetical protein
MGLKQDTLLSGGLVISDAYIRINEGTITGSSISLDMKTYKNKETRDGDIYEYLVTHFDRKILPIDNDIFVQEVLPHILNLKAALYKYLKTTEEYQNATDVLEDN